MQNGQLMLNVGVVRRAGAIYRAPTPFPILHSAFSILHSALINESDVIDPHGIAGGADVGAAMA